MAIHSGDKFGTINRLLNTRRLMPWFLSANVLLLAWICCVPPAEAALSVAVTPATLEPGYRVERIYAGEVRAARTSTLGFRHAGEVHHVHVREGDQVVAGQVLAQLDSRPLRAAREQAAARLEHASARIRMADAALELARETYRRHHDLAARGHTSAQRYDEVRLELNARVAELEVARAEVRQAQAALKAAEVDLEASRIHAPYAARIQTRHVDEGGMVVAGQAVLRVVEQGPREARVGLPVDVAGTLGADARYRFRSNGDIVHGTLLERLPEVDPRTRTVTALFRLEANAAPGPAPGSLIELTLERRVPEPGYWLPLAALSEAQRGLWSVFAVVTAADGRQRVERRLVEILHTRADRVFVRGTLTDGESIVATGTQRVVPGQVVAARPAP